MTKNDKIILLSQHINNIIIIFKSD